MDASAWDERYRSADRLWSAEPNLFVVDRLRGAQPGAGLDVAAGDGRNSIFLADRGWSMTAVDFSEVAVQLGRSLTSDVRFQVGDVTAYEPDQVFDLVLFAYLHLGASDMAALVGRSLSWLKPGGELFMIGHDKSNIEDGHGGPQVPEVLWDVDETLAWLDGTTVIEAVRVRRPVEIDDGRVYAIDTLVRAQA